MILFSTIILFIKLFISRFFEIFEIIVLNIRQFELRISKKLLLKTN